MSRMQCRSAEHSLNGPTVGAETLPPLNSRRRSSIGPRVPCGVPLCAWSRQVACVRYWGVTRFCRLSTPECGSLLRAAVQ